MKNKSPQIKIISLSMIAMTILLIFLVGCTMTSSDVKNYRVGTNGLILEFSKSNPASVYEQEEFGNSVVINNVGATDITIDNPAKIIVSYDTYRLQSSGANGNIELTGIYLQGKNQYYPVGEDFPFNVYFKSNSLTHLRESSTTSINYNLCFPYTTELTTMMCIDTKTATRDDSPSACISEPYTGGGGQGAPIEITKIEPEILLQNNYVRPQFKIYIENVGGGYVTSKVRCDQADFSDKTVSDKVNVRASLSGVELQCGPVESTEMLRLTDSESFIRCFLPASAAGYSAAKKSYTTPLTVKVYYTYQVIAKQDIEILRNELVEPNISQGLCASYQIEDGGRCISKCEYCSKNPGSDLCKDNKPYPNFEFGKGFSCSCTLDKCNEKLSKGSCIKGYCPEDLYCCSTNQCDAQQVEYLGTCIDKCQYCTDTSHKLDPVICGTYNFTGFSCQSITEAQCTEYAKSASCVVGYCGGTNINSYCANPSKAQSAASANTAPAGTGFITGDVVQDAGAEISNTNTDTNNYDAYYKDFVQSGFNRCDYCSQDKTDNPLCKFTNKDIVGRVGTTFSCVCEEKEANSLKNYQFVPDKSFCDNGMYCCDLMGI